MQISVVLHTVRPDRPYPDEPERHVIGSVVEDLADQTFTGDFELVVVDGLFPGRRRPWWNEIDWVRWVGPLDLFWVRHRKVAINSMKLTGLVHARGELVISIDDVCRLPPTYLEDHWRAYRDHGVCLCATWRSAGDPRLKPGEQGRRAWSNEVWGFHSYPLGAALALGGQDLAYDGARGLEDGDWGHRLTHGAGVSFGLWDWEPGFKICRPKAQPDPACVDPLEPLAGCCNRAWRIQREIRGVMVANGPHVDETLLRYLRGPCQLLRADGETCDHHGERCPYLGLGFVRRCHPLAEQLTLEDLRFDLERARKEAR